MKKATGQARIRVSVTAILALALLASACGSNSGGTADEPVDTPTSSTEIAGNPTDTPATSTETGSDDGPSEPLTVASFPGTALTLPLTVAQEQGFLADEGLDVTVIEIGSGPQITAALIGGSAQVAVAAPGTYFPAVVGGEDLRVLPPFMGLDWNLVALSSSGMSTVEDLEGKRVGVAARGGAYEAYLNQYLQQEGIDPDGYVTWVALGPVAAAAEGIDSGQVDALSTTATAVANLRGRGIELDTIVSAPEGTAGAMGDVGVGSFYMTTPEHADSELIAAFCEGMFAAVEWIHDEQNTEAGAAVMASEYGIPEEEALALWNQLRDAYAEEITPDRWEQVAAPFADGETDLSLSTVRAPAC